MHSFIITKEQYMTLVPLVESDSDFEKCRLYRQTHFGGNHYFVVGGDSYDLSLFGARCIGLAGETIGEENALHDEDSLTAESLDWLTLANSIYRECFIAEGQKNL